MKRLKAFTLLEVVIALAVLCVGLVGILSLFPVGFYTSRRATMQTEATINAQDKMEEIKATDFDSITSSGDWDDFSDDSGIQWQTTVTTIDPPGDLKNIELEVRWQEKGVWKIEKFTTYIAKLD